MKLLEKVKERVHQDYKLLIEEELKKDKQNIINGAYRIAHYNEIDDFFDNLYDEDETFDKEEYQKILNYKGNFVDKVWNDWLNYNHSEYYNFFAYEGLIDIISNTIIHL